MSTFKDIVETILERNLSKKLRWKVQSK